MKPPEPLTDPCKILNDLFVYQSITEYQRELWKWISLTVSGTYHEQPPTERSDILFLYEKMTELVQGAHAIRQERRGKGEK